MKTHTMNLQKIPFETIKNGSKIIESRLYDEKRKDIRIGDTIIFECTTIDPIETLETRVVALYLYPDFQSLMSDFPSEYFGATDTKTATDEVNKYYQQEDQKKYGVIGIKIEKKSNIIT